MPTEASRVCRIMWDFAGVYRDGVDDGHPLFGQSHDIVYLVVWSLLVLNSDAHNPKVHPPSPRFRLALIFATLIQVLCAFVCVFGCVCVCLCVRCVRGCARVRTRTDA